MVFTTEGFFEVAIESWPEWDLNRTCKPQTDRTTYIYIYTHTYIYLHRYIESALIHGNYLRISGYGLQNFYRQFSNFQNMDFFLKPFRQVNVIYFPFIYGVHISFSYSCASYMDILKRKL